MPDYRSPGRPPYRPIQHQDFVSSAAVRQRYWARSTAGEESADRGGVTRLWHNLHLFCLLFFGLGYARSKLVHPNVGHYACAALLRHFGPAAALITQNVDGLHEKVGRRQRECLVLSANIFGLSRWSQAGALNVLPLHGSLSKVRCLSCSEQTER